MINDFTFGAVAILPQIKGFHGKRFTKDGLSTGLI